MTRTLAMLLAGALAAPCAAQGLLTAQPNPVPLEGQAPDPAARLYGVSMFAVRPPEKKVYRVHDLVTIIINESSQQTSEQTLETQKSVDYRSQIRALVDFQKLLELQLEQGDTNLTLLDLIAEQDYEGEGEYERKDRFTDRITAQVIDVKPNGMLVLEARRTIQVDEESKTLVLSGNCMSESVTAEGVVQSNELADLRVIVEHEGALRQAASKGWFTRALDFLFPF
ncbi:MAG: flagellar basal body L-ring protein FlgH [Phycisphaerales bacterium JB039]